MKKYEEGKRKEYKFYCDMCKEEISYKDKTMKQIHIQYDNRKKRKKWDLCNKHYKAIAKAIERYGRQ